MFSDRTIRVMLEKGEIVITPTPEPYSISMQPASVELRLGNQMIRRGRMKDQSILVEEGERITIVPGACFLARTVEWIELPDNIYGRVEGKSTWGRKFLQVHSTAGFIDPGFKGTLTLELKNEGEQPIFLTPTVRICQISFGWMDCQVERPYGHPDLRSHYQGQVEPALPHGEDLR